MADLSLTASAIVAGSGAYVLSGTAGATITAGQAVYLDSSDSKYKLADCDSATAAVRDVVGIALNGASDGQPIDIITEGDLTVGSVLTGGIPYFLSPNAGGICPIADIAVGDYYTIIGIAKSATVLSVKIHASGFQRAS